MIRVEVDGVNLELFPDRDITIESHCPLFYDELTARAFSYPLRVPASDHNKIALGIAHRIDRPAQITPRVGSIFLGSVRIVRGEVVLSKYTDRSTTFELAIREDAVLPDGRVLAKALEETSIRDVVEEGVVMAGTSNKIAAWVFDPLPSPGPTYNVNIDGVSYFVNATSGTTEQNISQLVSQINAVYPGYAGINFGQSPTRFYLFSDRVTETPFAPASIQGMTLIAHETSATVFHDLVQDWVKKVRDNGASQGKFFYPLIRWDAFYAGANARWLSLVNPSLQGTDSPRNVPEVDKGTWRYSYVPMMSMYYVIERIWLALGLQAGNALVPESNMSQLLIWNNRSHDAEQADVYPDKVGSIPFTTSVKFMNSCYEQFIRFADNLPDVTALELFQALSEWYGIYLRMDGSYIELRRKRSLIDNPAEFYTWTSKVEEAYELDLTAGTGLKLKWGVPDDEGVRRTDQLNDFQIGRGVETVKTAAAPPYMSEVLVPQGDLSQLPPVQFSTALVPWTSMKGSNNIGLGATQPPLRFVHYAGAQPAVGLGLYAYATTVSEDAVGDDTGLEELTWQGDRGLYNRHLKGVIDLVDGRPLGIQVQLSSLEFAEILRWDKANVQFSHNRGNFRGVIRRVRLRVRPSDISMPLVEAEVVDTLQEQIVE